MARSINRRQFINKVLTCAAGVTSAGMLSGCMESLTGERGLLGKVTGGNKKPNFVRMPTIWKNLFPFFIFSVKCLFNSFY